MNTCNFSLLLAIIISSLPVKAANDPRTLDQIVRERVESETSNNKALNIGRQSLLNEMKKFPEQLALDIKRNPISIGGTLIKISTEKDARDTFLIIAMNLEKYLDERVPTIKKASASGHIGVFSITEIIYAIVQNFLGPVTTRAYNEIGAAGGGEWGPLKGKKTLSASFNITDKNMLQVSLKSEQLMQNMKDDKIQKNLILLSNINFNLDTGVVTFNDSYEFPIKPKSSRTRTVFDGK